VVVVNGKKVAQNLVNGEVTAAGVRYNGKPYTNAAPTPTANSAVDGFISKVSAATTNRSTATIHDRNSRASPGASWSGALRNKGHWAATGKHKAPTARGITEGHISARVLAKQTRRIK